MTEAVAEAESEATVQEGTEPAAEVVPLTRREFLYYLWGISLAVFTAGSTGATIWFTLPRFREGEFGGVIRLSVEEVPPLDSPPKAFPSGRFWLVNLGQGSINDPRQPGQYVVDGGVRALYMVCVHLGCLFKWVPTNDRFECPCHGSKYLLSGSRTDGPATRNLDTFVMEVLDADGNVLTRSEPTLNGRDGGSVQIAPEAVTLSIDTGKRIQGHLNTLPGGGF